LNADKARASIGLHLTLTAPFAPMSQDYGPQRDGEFLPLTTTLRSAMFRGLKPEKLTTEIETQIKSFVAAFGRPPDFIDGHQHVHLFPQIRDAVLVATKTLAPDAWLRQCGRSRNHSRSLSDKKALLLDILSVGFRRRALRLGLVTNPAFAGTYDFTEGANFAALFPTFLKELPDGGVVMCHPGTVDAELERLDPLTTLRETEYAFFKSYAFLALLAHEGVTLA
jgi:predicted glycoside hydrolase/deacetylase ChbG (UPF0249 family)